MIAMNRGTVAAGEFSIGGFAATIDAVAGQRLGFVTFYGGSADANLGINYFSIVRAGGGPAGPKGDAGTLAVTSGVTFPAAPNNGDSFDLTFNNPGYGTIAWACRRIGGVWRFVGGPQLLTENQASLVIPGTGAFSEDVNLTMTVPVTGVYDVVYVGNAYVTSGLTGSWSGVLQNNGATAASGDTGPSNGFGAQLVVRHRMGILAGSPIKMLYNSGQGVTVRTRSLTITPVEFS